MNRACLSCISVLSLGVLACVQGNPDFNKSSVGDEIGDTATDESGTATGTDAGTSDSNTSAEAGTADAGTTTMGTTDATADTTDTNVEPCTPTLAEPLRIAFGDPSFNNDMMCFTEYVGRVRPFDIKDGEGWMVYPTTETCQTLIETQHPLKVSGIPAKLADLYPPQPQPFEDLYPGCFFIAVEGFLGQDMNTGECLYSSVRIWNGNGPETLLVFAAVRDDVGISYYDPMAQVEADWKPDTETIRENCSCDTVEDNVDCCPDLGAVTTYDFIVGDNMAMSPPVEINLPFLATDYTFYGKQAQSAQVCGHPKQVSWALWRPL